MINNVDVKILDGNLVGYLTVSELAKKNGVTECAIRRRWQKKQLDALVLGHGTSSVLFFPEDTVIPILRRGRPKKVKKNEPV